MPLTMGKLFVPRWIGTFLFSVVFVGWLLLSLQASAPALALSEVKALQSIYEEAGGPYWVFKKPYSHYGNPWNFTDITIVNPCQDHWQGIACKGSLPNHVILLSLLDLNLNGSISVNISALSYLQTFEMAENPLLSGPIPTQIVALTQLQYVYLYSNTLTGCIPPQIGHLPDLVELYLYSNKLTGTIPQVIGNLTKLQQLTVYSNMLTGSIPKEIGNLTQLLILHLGINELTGSIPFQLCNLLQLQQMDLYSNKLTGSIPWQIGNLSRLKLLIVDSNVLTGPIPSQIGSLSNLNDLYLYSNMLTGSIPHNIGALSQLQFLLLDLNELTGSIPPQIGSLSELLILYLDSNMLTGSFPTQISNLTQLWQFASYSNMLTGSIPMHISNLSQLQILSIGSNLLTGSIPIQIAYMSQLQELVANTNILTGFIPQQIGQLYRLQILQLYLNKLSGPIPSQIGNLTQMQEFILYSNMLTGPIPPEICSMSSLLYLYLSSNMLTGPVPLAIDKLSQLQQLSLYSNMLTGPIPLQIFALSQLQSLSMHSNLFTGSISPQIGTLTQLSYLYLASNTLTGPIPSQIGNLPQLQILGLFSNELTGHITPQIVNASELVQLSINSNLLTGSILPQIGNLSHLADMYLYSNQLTGTIPPQIGNMPQLKNVDVGSNILSGPVVVGTNLSILIMSQNMLSGSIPSLNDSSFLTCFDLSDNLLTGSLPSFASSPSLVTAVMAINCIHSDIPTSYCHLTQLETLVLDGLNSAAGCRKSRDDSLLSPSLQSANRRSGIFGGLPACLFNMSSLQTLQISGNGIVGTIPDDIDYISIANLTNLDMSHNVFVGKIPSWIWAHDRWEILDLSFNRLTGYLPPYLLSPPVSLSLNINRLSGIIPSWIQNVSTINVLNGNIFGCSIDRTNLPNHDPYSRSYTCGSDTVDGGLIVWGVVVLLVTLFIVVTLKPGSTGVATTVAFFFGNAATDGRSTSQTVSAKKDTFAHWLVHLCQCFVQIGLLVVICCGMPLYVANSAYFSMYETKYVWAVSACYLSGRIPAVLMLTLFLLLLGLVQWFLIHRSREVDPTADQEQPSREQVPPTSHIEPVMIAVQYLLVAVIVVVVLVVNAAFVFASTRKDISVEELLALTVSLSVFKIVCGWFTVHRLRWSVHKMTRVLSCRSPDSATELPWQSTLGARLSLLMNIFNNVVTPYCAEMFVNADCFLYVWSAVPAKTSQYSIPSECSSVINVSENIETTTCTPSLVNTLTFNPTYSYDYLCSSSLISTFSFVFLLRYLISATGQAVISLVLSQWVASRYRPDSLPQAARSDLNSADDDRGMLWRAAWHILPFQHRPLQWFVDQYALDRPQDGESVATSSYPHAQRTSLASSPSLTMPAPLSDMSAASTASSAHFSLSSLLPSRNEVAVRLVTDLSLFATYGVLFPPLGLVIGSAICLDVYLLVHYHWLRAETLVSMCPHLQPQLSAIKEVFGQLDGSVYQALDRVSYLVAVFWSFTLFDTLGAEVGALNALWIVLLTCTAPAWIRAVFWLYRTIQQPSTTSTLPGAASVTKNAPRTDAADADMGPQMVMNPLYSSRSSAMHSVELPRLPSEFTRETFA